MDKLKQVILLFLCVALTMASCQKVKNREIRSAHADSVLFAAGAVMDYARMEVLIDSFAQTGDINEMDINRWRGVVAYHQKQFNASEKYYRQALECEVKTSQDQKNYNKCARRLSELLLVRGDYEGSLKVAVPAVKKIDETKIGSDIDYAILLNNIGCCQLNLGRDQEAKTSFEEARQHYINRWTTDTTSRGFQEAVLGTVYTSQAYINTRRYADAIYWINRTEMLLDKYRQCADARTEYFDEYQGRIEVMRAVAMESLDSTAKAAEAYRRFQETAYSKTAAGRINGNDYLMLAKRYEEAADNYRYLDQALQEWSTDLSLDNIQLYMLPKYVANERIGRKDSTMRIGQRIIMMLDSAISGQKINATAELATIYDTQGKEAEIAQQQMRLTQQRLVSTGVALVLLIVFFLIYTLHKRKSAHKLAAAHGRLEEAHAKLKVAYDQLEETTQIKERIQSELRIARDIQMSMVPNVFPDIEGVDMYAAMTPAKEVGGDLYGYMIQGDELYFCLGDVSGKGVPASLFMAQANRMFRTLGSEHMKPAAIATRMNNALTENNGQGMFVTMFMGLIDLKTGRLDYCNAGHNPPVIGYPPKFMEVESNAPIGLWPGLEFVGETIENIKGVPIFVYSDGLNEAENKKQEQFSDERILQVLSDTALDSAKKVVLKLMDEVNKHRDGADPNDDLTMLCLKIN
ncbi:MAG: serine/threonine-protein phosphatase [Prevotella sp.]|nr:serine/threonine-protein phosphatase [Prevotella sp.]